MTDQAPSTEDVHDQIAEAVATSQDSDYWVDEIRDWEARADWEREAQADSQPGMAYEDQANYRQHAADVLATLSTPTEAMVEAGAGADAEHGYWWGGMRDPGVIGCQCGWRYIGPYDHTNTLWQAAHRRHRATAIFTAMVGAA